MKKTSYINSISEVLDLYDLFILDQWGVMHDGKTGYPNAIKCVQELIKNKKKIIIISNSSKRKITTVKRLPELGFDPSNFIEVMTSGEMIWQFLKNKSHNFIKDVGMNCLHLYDKDKEDSLYFRKDLDYNFVENIKDADFILGCATEKNKSTIDYVPLLKKAIEKNIPFICANPDYETIENSKNKLSICMGSIAELYKQIGGKTFILGKPDINIYIESAKKLKDIEKSRFLAIGDSIFHDIKGANNYEIDSLLITSGIHKSDLIFKGKSWNQEGNKLIQYNINPSYYTSIFKF